MSIESIFIAGPASTYDHLTSGGANINLVLTQDECSVALKAYDYGVEQLSAEEAQLLDAVISKLKDKIHP